MIAVGEQLLKLLIIGVGLTAVGQLVAWWMHHRTLLAASNLYLASLVTLVALTGSILVRSTPLTIATTIAAVVAGTMTLTASRERRHALGGGGELRRHELSRRWVWQPRPHREPGEHVYIGRQGEIVHVKPWHHRVEFVSMTDRRNNAARLPLGEGQHVFLVGATGAGKTTTARRLLAARVLAGHSSLVILDQKGDVEDVAEMRRLAAAAGVPFVLFDSQDPDTDRWQPLWGSPGAVAARATVAIKQSEPYYYDVLRKHLDIVCKVLHAADKWPPSVPYLLDACEPTHYPAIMAMAEGLSFEHEAVKRRALRHGRWVKSRKGTEDLAGGVLRLETALALASSTVVTPRVTPDGFAVGVSLVQALRRRAIVMWRTHADSMPDEAAALTAVALSDLHAAAGCDVGPWTVLLDEFGAVIQHTALQALGILQRGRSHHGQAIVITQSVADIEALTNTPGLLDSLTDNFSGVVAHRQSSPDSREWLARLIGTRELWQHTDQTDGHGGRRSGRGSSRRVHEFIVPPDVFGSLDRGEAVIYTPESRQAARTVISPVVLADLEPERIDGDGACHEVEIVVHPEHFVPLSSSSVAAVSDRAGAGDNGDEPPDSDELDLDGGAP